MTKYLCPSLLPMTVINTMTKKAERENSLFDYTGGHQWKPGRELEAGTWRQGLTQRRWRCAALACSACFRMHPRPPSQGCTAHSGLGSHTPVIDQENSPTDLTTGQL